MRLFCKLFGCRFDRNYQCCDRCGAALYEEFIDSGPLSRVAAATKTFFRAVWSRIAGHKCMHCGKRFWGSGYFAGEVCSQECDRKYIPF